jgi:hypothetical protein
MTNYPEAIKTGLVTMLLFLFLSAANSRAAEFTLAWDAHETTHTILIGYNLYYKADSSVQADPDESTMVYIPSEEPGFDPNHPSYTVTGLEDHTEYYFTVTAMVGDEESGMSNEVSAANGAAGLGSTPSGNSGGCFIDTLE